VTDVHAAGDGPLIGRARELRELRESLARARRGQGGVHLVLGDPGVGKTRLAAALAEDAVTAGATVVWTRGWGRVAPPYWPWAEVVRRLCHGVDGDVLRRELGERADALVRLAPELAERLGAPQPAAEAPGVESSDVARFALFDALVALLRARSANAPVVVLVDDLQALDEGSLLALDFVSRMLSDAAVLIVVTMHARMPRRTAGAQAALANIARAGRRLVLGGLDRPDVAELIELTSGAPPPPCLVDAIHDVTEGNPFFAREILALLLAEGRLNDLPEQMPLPDSVLETVRRRLEPLGDDAIATLALAAIIGRTFSVRALELASPLAGERVLAALDAAAGLGLIVEMPAPPGHFRFGHGLIVRALVAGMPAVDRMAAHRAVGEVLEHLFRGAIDNHLPRLAHHFVSAGPRGDLAKAVDYAQRAAERALADLAYEQAAELFERALHVLALLGPDPARRAALLLGLGTAQSRADRPAARATLAEAVAAARAIGADELLARAALGAAPFALTPGTVDDARVALLVEALERIGPRDSALRVRLLGSLAIALYWSDTRARRAELAREALDVAHRVGDDATLAFALASAQLATAGPDTTEQSLRWLQQLFAITEQAGESAMTLAARSRHIDVLLELDDVAGANVAIETLERLATAARDRRALALVPLHRARRAALEGRFDDAHALVAEVAAMSGELPDSTIPITVGSQSMMLTWLQHGPEAIGDQVRAYADGVPAMPVWRAALAASLAAAGRTAEAELELERLAADDFAALPQDSLWLVAMALVTEAIAALELPVAAARVLERLAPFAGRNVVTPTSAFLGPVELWLGILARISGRPARALEHLAAARASATRNGARTSLARIDVEEAAVLLAGPGAVARSRAAELLAGASRVCEELGLTRTLERATALQLRSRAVAPSPAVGAASEPADEAVTTLRRIGDVWTIDDGHRLLHISDGRGVRLLALLLARPGVSIHSLDLVAAVNGTSPAPAGAARAADPKHADPSLDDAARRAYRRRIDVLDAQIAEARRAGDAVSADRAGSERRLLARELDRALGIGDRDREPSPHAERARVNVTRAIRSALRKIAGYDARLGAELESAVRTGTYCAYEPDRLRPRRWRVIDGRAR